MISPGRYPWSKGLLFFILVICSFQARSQCNPPDQLPTINCQSAPLVCLENACYETLNNPFNCCTGWCGAQTAIHNPQYFQFVATDMNVELIIHVDGCNNGNALQSAILDACPWDNSNVVDCDPGTPVGGNMVLNGNNFIPGNTYWLVIDGSSGATCEYTISSTMGIYAPGLEGEITSGEAIPDEVCQGYDFLYLVVDPPVANAHGYFWELEWTGDVVTSTLNNIIVDVPGTTPPGDYEICVKAFSGCDTSDTEFCFEVTVYEIPPEEKDPEIFCPEEFPFSWGSLTINGAGEYEQTYITPEGCFFDSTWVVESYPEPELGLVDTLHCLPLGENTFFYEGDPYDQAGTYPLFYPNGDINGCDSMAELELVLIGIDAFIELTCENGEFVLTAYNQEVIPFNADIEYTWYEQNGPQVGDENPLLTLQDGCYDLYVKVIVPEGFCEFFIETFCFDADDYYPPAPTLANTDTLICAQEGIFFYVIEDPNGEPFLEYEWSAPFNVPVYQDGSGTVEMDFSNSSGGTVCVFATGMCGSGSSTCFEVDIIPAPEADFTFDPEVCINESNIITFTGSASPNAEILWDFSSPTSITGSGIGPYTVSWASPGNKAITLTVIEPGCDTAFNSAIITVQQLTAPTINCTSTISSIEFDWNDIPGASGYLVSINGGPATPVSSSDTLLSPLAPGTMIELILTVVSGGACPNIVDTMVCTAEDCPPPMIDLTGQDSACLNNPTIIDLDAVVNGSPGTGTWSGPGIVDPVMGLFDPKVASSGIHQVTYTVDVNGCPFNRPYTITVFDSITADFTLDPTICITEEATVTYTGNASPVPAATYNYNFGTAVVESGTGEGPFQLSWPAPGMKTVRLQVSENGCMSDLISRTTNVVANLVAPVVPCSPNTSGVVFSWTLDNAAVDSMINVLSGHVGTQTGNTYTFDGLVAGDIVQIEIVTIGTGPCPARRDTFECEARACPMPVIVVSPVPDICLYPGTGNVDLEVSVTNGNGTGVWSGTGVTDVVNGVFDPVLAGEGAHLITYRYTDDECDFLNTITINVYDVPEALITNTDLVLTCTSGSIFLDGSSSSGGPLSYSWSTGNGVIGSGANTDEAEAIAPGVYKLVVTNMVSGCQDSTTITVTQDDNIPIPVAGPDRVLTCDSLAFTIGGGSTMGTDIIYNWTTVGGAFNGPTNGITAVAIQTGTYTIIVRDTITGCQAQDQMVVSIDTALATITLTPGDTIDCNTTTSNATTMLNEPMVDYTFNWTTADGLIGSGGNTPTPTVSQGGTYTLTIHNIRNGCEKSEDVVIAESDEIIDAVNVNVKNITCFGDNDGVLEITSVEGGTPDYTYTWSVSPGGTTLSSLAPGTYGLTVSDQNGCSFAQALTITEPDRVTMDVGPNLTVAAGDSVRIDLLTNVPQEAVSSIEWGGYDGLFCPGCPSFQFIAATSATISATVVDTSGCTATDSLRLTVIVPRIIFIPNVFSPDGDGINDNFTISGRFNLINIASMKIFDRWGNQVFERLDMTPGDQEMGWDGNFNNEPMQPGVYVFVAELDYEDISETVSGSITLVR